VRDYLDIAIVFCVEPVKHRRPITPSAAIPSWPPATGGDGLLSLAVACPWPVDEKPVAHRIVIHTPMNDLSGTERGP
jgi:hypothetical protein